MNHAKHLKPQSPIYGTIIWILFLIGNFESQLLMTDLLQIASNSHDISQFYVVIFTTAIFGIIISTSDSAFLKVMKNKNWFLQ